MSFGRNTAAGGNALDREIPHLENVQVWDREAQKLYCNRRFAHAPARFADPSTGMPHRRAKGGLVSSAISSLLSTVSVNAVNAARTNPANSALAQTSQANAATGDTVTLSPSQQAHQLYQQGQAISQIAVALGLSVETVNGYLNISSTKS